MLCPLHVVLGSVFVRTDVGDLLVLGLPVIFLSCLKVILVLVVSIRIPVVLELLGKLEDNLVLLSDVLVVGVH